MVPTDLALANVVPKMALVRRNSHEGEHRRLLRGLTLERQHAALFDTRRDASCNPAQLFEVTRGAGEDLSGNENGLQRKFAQNHAVPRVERGYLAPPLPTGPASLTLNTAPPPPNLVPS